MTEQRSYPLALAQLLREAMPKELEEFHRTDTDTGQAAVWLVGLGSTLLALMVANPERVNAVVGNSHAAVVVLLLTTVAAGVLYRILGVWVSQQGRALIKGLYGYLTGYTAGVALELPAALADAWDETEIVRRLRSEFGLDYGFLMAYGVPLEGCRDAYRGQYDLWKQHEEETLDVLKSIIAAHMGWTEAQTKRRFERTSNTGLAKVRHRAFLIRGLRLVGAILFTVSAFSFMLAISLVARGLWQTR